MRDRASPRWAARTPASSPPPPTSSAPRPASCARPTAWAGRSARRCRACTSTNGRRRPHADGSRRRSTRSASAIRVVARTGSVRSSTSARTSLCAVRRGPARPAARIRRGGSQLHDGELARGFYVEPVLAEAPLEHALWRARDVPADPDRARVASATRRCASPTIRSWVSPRASTAAQKRSQWFHDHIEAGVTYANRAAGRDHRRLAGLPALRRLERLGSTGKAIASFYYLPLYLREQSRTVVE